MPAWRRHRGARIGALERWHGAGVGAPERRLGIEVCLDPTFQDAGGWLMDIVDEGPAWGWIPPGG